MTFFAFQILGGGGQAPCPPWTRACYMPSSMIKSIIVPLVKNKCGNLADKNNYRPIASSSISSKVFEHVILFCMEDYLWTNDNQFGLRFIN